MIAEPAGSWISADWDAPGNVVALTTSRAGGVSTGNFSSLNLAFHVGDDPDHVKKNGELLQRSLAEQVDFQWLQQSHGARVVQAGRSGVPQPADAAFTSETGLACCVLTADCLPVFLTNKSGDAVALAHAGWRGLAAGILERTIAQFPASPAEVIAWLGPAIGPCHFQVGNDVKQAILDVNDSDLMKQLSVCFVDDCDAGKYRADLYQIATVKLQNLGVEVSGGGLCTYCDAASFYSFRRQENTGRMASLIYLKS